MYSYTAVHLEQKTFRELKSIARDLALVPLGDRRCRQNWVDVIVGAPLPLLQLLEVSPGVELVQDAIKVQVQDLIEVQVQKPLIESKFGRIIYPKPIVKPIAPVVENSPAVAEGDRSLPLVEYAAQNFLGVAEGDRLLVVTEHAAQNFLGVAEGDRLLVVTEHAAQNFLGVAEGDRLLVVTEHAAQNSPGVAEGDRLLVVTEHAAQNSPGVAEGDRSLPLVEYAAQNSLAVAEGDRSLPLVEYAAQTSPGVETVQEAIEVQVQEPIESKLEPAVFQALTFSDALEICRLVSEALPAKTLKKLQMLRLKVLDLIARPGADCFHGNSKHKSSWIHEIRSELTYLLEIRAIAFAPPLGLGRHISPGCLKRSWEIPTPPSVEPVEEVIKVQVQEPIEVQVQEAIESKFGCIIYPKPAVKPIAQNAETRPQLDRTESADVHNWRSHPAESVRDSSSAKAEAGSKEGDRILEVALLDSGSAGGDLPHQLAQLTQSHDSHIRSPQALTEQRPPGRGDGRGGYVELAIGMLVGRRRDRLHLGKILDIYCSKRGIWRAKIQPLNKPRFVYFDCAALVEQRLLYDYEMKPGGFLPSGQIFDKNRGANFQVYSRKVRAKPTIWTPGQLSQLSTFKLKQIARDMDIPSIPGSLGKRSLIRAILVEQAISQEKAAAQRENISQTAQKQKPALVASSKKRTAASPLGNQLSLFDVAV